MADYRDRRISGIMIPFDERVEIPGPEEHSIREWLEILDIKYFGTVNASSKFNMQGLIDDDGLDRRLPWNPRAHFITGYPVDHPIVGNMLMVSMEFTGEGHDVVSLKQEGIDWLGDKAARGEEFSTWLRQPVAQGYFHEYRLRFPQPPVTYPKG